MSITISQTEDLHAPSLRGKTCLVTGGSRGIGRAIALEFARNGADVAVNYRSSQEDAAHVVDSIEAYGETGIAIQSDVAELDSVERMAQEVGHSLGEVDVLVNNAGITADSKFEHMTREEWERVIDVNLGGTFNCTRTFFEDIRQAPQGRVINIASVVGQAGNFGQANYAASKSGLFGLTRTLAVELAGTGSTANCVSPGFIETDMLAGVPDRIRDVIRERIPEDRFGTPEEVAGLVRFIATDASGYMNGQVIGVNGGLER